MSRRDDRPPSTVAWQMRSDKWNAGERECWICKQPFTGWWDCTLDHIIPLRDGGPTTHENTKLAHALCNTRRHHTPRQYYRLACTRCDATTNLRKAPTRPVSPCWSCGGEMKPMTQPKECRP